VNYVCKLMSSTFLTLEFLTERTAGEMGQRNGPYAELCETVPCGDDELRSLPCYLYSRAHRGNVSSSLFITLSTTGER
jgi:hypothetical protein